MGTKAKGKGASKTVQPTASKRSSRPPKKAKGVPAPASVPTAPAPASVPDPAVNGEGISEGSNTFKFSVVMPVKTTSMIDWCVNALAGRKGAGRAITRSFVVREAIRAYYILLGRLLEAEASQGIGGVQTEILDLMWGSTPDANVREVLP
jgi:hypothetical protein